MTNKYCQKHRERLQKEALEKYQNLSKKKKEKGKKRPVKDIKI